MARAEGQTGIFVVWDEEDVQLERRDAGTRFDRTVVVERKMKSVYALWTNEVSEKEIAAAVRYVQTDMQDGRANPRVEVFTK